MRQNVLTNEWSNKHYFHWHLSIICSLVFFSFLKSIQKFEVLDKNIYAKLIPTPPTQLTLPAHPWYAHPNVFPMECREWEQ